MTDIHEYDLELAIIEELARVGPSTFEELRQRVPSYSWDEMFFEVDLLRREGIIGLQRTRSLEYIIFLSLPRTVKSRARHLRRV